MSKKLSVTLIVLALLAVAAVPAFAKGQNTETEGKETGKQMNLKLGQKDALYVGNAGVFIRKVGTAGELEVDRVKIAEGMHENLMQGVQFIGRLLNWDVENSKGNMVKSERGRAYVIFHLTRSQMNDFNSNKISIYHQNTADKTWTKLPTFKVNGKAKEVAAVARGFGNYGLGMIK